MELRWSDYALESLGEMSDYICDTFSWSIAQDVVDKIFRDVQILESSPRLGFRVDEMSRYGEIRCLILRRDKVFYIVDGNTIEIVIVWDGKRDAAKLMDRLLDYFGNR